MNVRLRMERLQLILATHTLMVGTLTLVAMFIVPEVRNLVGLRVAGSETIVQTPPEVASPNSKTVDPMASVNLEAIAYVKLDVRQRSKTESGRIGPARTVEGLTRRQLLRKAISLFKSNHSRDPNETELDALIEYVLLQRVSGTP